ncbi:unnamed protein product [Meganyctiphanes norvegica]|uniref:VLRF1 domain-containing protein n=1 Tax=Meganyctiphanes norvegica TaxID=48144 RepID=A0AAV2RGZ3_MEGNR
MSMNFPSEMDPNDTNQNILIPGTVSIDVRTAVLVLSGGKFAGEIFRNKDVVKHTTFKYYTVRARQGGSQSARDKKGRCKTSVGSQMRRENETMFEQKLIDRMKEWKETLDKCDYIYYQAAKGSINFSILFGGSSMFFNRQDVRLKKITHPIRAITFEEIKRIHSRIFWDLTHPIE